MITTSRPDEMQTTSLGGRRPGRASDTAGHPEGVLAALADVPSGLTLNELRELRGGTLASVSVALVGLEQQGLVTLSLRHWKLGPVDVARDTSTSVATRRWAS